MSDRQTNHLESHSKEAPGNNDATARLQQEAAIYHRCQDGSVVTKPKDCREGSFSLPSLQIDNDEKVAGKTFRRGPDGVTTDGGKMLA